MRYFSMGTPCCNSKPDKFVAVYKGCREFLLSMENRWEVTAEQSEFR